MMTMSTPDSQHCPRSRPCSRPLVLSFRHPFFAQLLRRASVWSCLLLPASILLLLWLPHLRTTRPAAAPPQRYMNNCIIPVGVSGKNFVWNFTHPGPDSQTGTPDDVLCPGTLQLEPDS